MIPIIGLMVGNYILIRFGIFLSEAKGILSKIILVVFILAHLFFELALIMTSLAAEVSLAHLFK